MHIGPSLALTTAVAALSTAAPAVAGDILSASVRDSTAVEFIDGNCWTLDITVKGRAAGGTVSLASNKVQVTVRSQGNLAGGVATTVDEVLTATAVLRKTAPNTSSPVQVTSGSDVILTVVLPRPIFQPDQLLLVNIGSAFYTVSAQASNANSNVTATNLSTRAYPAVFWTVVTPQCLRFTSARRRVEVSAQHLLARNGRQTACMEIRVEDVATSTDQGISVFCNDTELSTTVTAGEKMEVFAGDIPITGLTQGVRYRAYFRHYAWVGGVTDSRNYSAPLTDNSSLTSLEFTCDKDGTHGDQIAYVKTGASGGTLNNPSAPYPTLLAALGALKTAHNAKSGGDQRNNAGGGQVVVQEDSAGAGATIQGTGGNASVHTAGATCLVEIRVDPAATGTVKIVTANSVGANRRVGPMCWFHGFTWERASVNANDNDNFIVENTVTTINTGLIYVSGGAVSSAGSAAFNRSPWRGFGSAYIYNVNGAANSGWLAPNGSECTQMAVVAGCTSTVAITLAPYVLMASRFNAGCNLIDVAGSASRHANRDLWVSNNRIKNQTQEIRFGNAVARPLGMVFSSNLNENKSGNAPTIIHADGSNLGCDNVIIWHNTIPGNRFNTIYTADTTISTEPLVKRGGGGFNIVRWLNSKSDNFWVANQGNADGNDQDGNWEWRFFVGRYGEVVIAGDSNSSPSPGPTSWYGEITCPGGTFTATVTFVNPQQEGVTGAGNGDYHLHANDNGASNRVPAGRAVFKYDNDGNLRNNGGFGAAGVYEKVA